MRSSRICLLILAVAIFMVLLTPIWILHTNCDTRPLFGDLASFLQVRRPEGNTQMPSILDPNDPNFMQLIKTKILNLAINSTIIIVPINYGSAHFMLNLRCSLRKLQITNVMYYAMDHKVFNLLAHVLKEPLVFYNSSVPDAEKMVLFGNKDTFRSLMRQRVRVWRWLLDEVGVNFWMLDADVVVLKDFRSLADAKYLLHPNAPYNALFGDRLPDVIMQMDGYSKDNVNRDLSDPNDKKELPKGCAGFFFLRRTPPSLKLIDRLLKAFIANPGISDQPVLNKLFKNSTYVRFLDVHPQHPMSYLYPDKQGNRFEPEILAKLLPQHKFVNGGVLTHHNKTAVKGADYWMVHPNGLIRKQTFLRQNGWWLLDDLNQCKYDIATQ